MYPELTPPLVVALAAIFVVLAFLVVRRPVLRRLALRQVARRPTEAALVLAGSVLGTALIVASFTVGDTLQYSVRGVAYDVLGPIDERVTSLDAVQGDAVAAGLADLADHPDVDGVLTARSDLAAVVLERDGERRAEPTALVWDVDFDEAEQFGGADGSSGLAGPDPGPGAVVLNQELADRLGAAVGDDVSIYLYGQPATFRVERVVPAVGLAGMGLGASENANAFLAPGTLTETAAAVGSGAQPATSTFVSNRGGVEDGADLTAPVVAEIRDRLASVAPGVAVVEAKQNLLDEARQTGDQLGALFLFISAFSIIAGVLLLVNVFVMLSEDRKGQLGMLRAMGMSRRRLVGSFAVEGAVYAVAAGVVGVLVGLGVGRGVAVLAERVLNQWDDGGGSLTLAFDVTWTSLVNGFAMGFVLAFATVVLTALRISRLNIIGAIRDLPAVERPGRSARRVIVFTIVAVLLALAAIPAVITSSSIATYALPALALLALAPLLLRRFSPRATWTAVSVTILAWGLVAGLLRPDVFDSPSMAVYVVLGVTVTFSAVLLVSENQQLVLWPVRRWLQRPSESGLTARLAVAYPTSRRFRTGATLVMYALIVFVVVLLTQITALIDASEDQAVADAGAGWTHRVDFNPSSPIPDPAEALTQGRFAGRVTDATPMLVATATSDDPGGRTDDPLPATVFGVDDPFASHVLALSDRLDRFGSDRGAWEAVIANEQYVIVDQWYGSTGGPGGDLFGPGDELTLTNSNTGEVETRTIAGLVESSYAFYGGGTGEFRYPAFLGPAAIAAQFGDDATASTFLVTAAPGEDDEELSTDLQGEFLSSGLVAVSIRQRVEQNSAATQSFFQLMQGFLGLGLLVGITGLGVVMVRAVRERRRTIGILRALGFQRRSIERAFVAESAFVAVEGVVLGAVLGVVTTWLLYQNSAAFNGVSAAYPIAWRAIAFVLVVTFVASMLATLGPARRAAGIRPALAVRVAD